MKTPISKIKSAAAINQATEFAALAAQYPRWTAEDEAKFDSLLASAESKKFPAWPHTSDCYYVFPDGSTRTSTCGDDQEYDSEQDLIDDCPYDFDRG